jgi:tetratricopeptide (TPR) repeat protein
MIKDVVVITISVLAFLVSLYGVWEKRRDVHYQQLLRLSSLVDELNSLNYEQDQRRDDFKVSGRPIPVGFNIIFNSRRELLCNEAEAIARRLGIEATSSQLRVIAASWSRTGYPHSAESLYREVISRDPNHVQAMFAWRGLGNLLMEQPGREGESRDAYRQAISLIPQVASFPEWEKADTYLSWANSEALMGERSQAMARILDAEEIAPTIHQPPRRKELLRRISSAKEDPLLSSSKAGEPVSDGK